MGMVPLTELETPEEIIILAYGLEKGLEEFYSAVAEKVDDPDVSKLLSRLAGIETKHRQKLFQLYGSLDPAIPDMDGFESGIVSERMEGGFTTETFLEKNSPSMDSTAGVLNMAMMLEAQGLDLYLRYSHKVKDEKGKTILNDIAEEEKIHLAYLGQLMEETYEEGGS